MFKSLRINTAKQLPALVLACTVFSPALNAAPDWNFEIFNPDTRLGDSVGGTVAISNGTVVVNSLDEHIQIYSRTNEQWSSQTVLTRQENNFGQTVAIDENTLIATNASWDNPTKLFTYIKTPDGEWQEEAIIVSTNEYSLLPSTVAIDGDTLMAGVRLASGEQQIYVFIRNIRDDWERVGVLSVPDLQDNESLSGRVAFSEDTAVISSVQEQNGRFYTGSVHIFLRDESGNWYRQTKLSPPEGRADPLLGGDVFGHTIALDGNHLLIGSYDSTGSGPACRFPSVCEEPPGPSYAYMYERDPNGEWSQIARFAADDPEERSFSDNVSIDSGVAVVGTDNSAYIYELAENQGWTKSYKYTFTERTGVVWIMHIDNYADQIALGVVNPAWFDVENPTVPSTMVLIGEKCGLQNCLTSQTTTQNEDRAGSGTDNNTVSGTGNGQTDNNQAGNGQTASNQISTSSGGGSLGLGMFIWLYICFKLRRKFVSVQQHLYKGMYTSKRF